MKIAIEKTAREMAEIEIKPCPFCGGEPNLEFDYADNMPCGVRIRCNDCGVGFYECFLGPTTYSKFDFADLVIAKWNKRANIDSE